MGEEPTLEGLRGDLTKLPPRTTPEDKYFLGYFRDGRLCAALDLILRYPNPETAFVGWFILRKDVQGRGVGTALVSELMDLLKAQGFRSVRLGRVKGNPESEAFWVKNQFTPTGVETDGGGQQLRKVLLREAADLTGRRNALYWQLHGRYLPPVGDWNGRSVSFRRISPRNFFANYNLTILDVGKVTIGSNVQFAPNVSIYTAGHPLHPDSRGTAGPSVSAGFLRGNPAPAVIPPPVNSPPRQTRGLYSSISGPPP